MVIQVKKICINYLLKNCTLIEMTVYKNFKSKCKKIAQLFYCNV